jgi:putative nucleotidyltransferase with HDIG domain
VRNRQELSDLIAARSANQAGSAAVLACVALQWSGPTPPPALLDPATLLASSDLTLYAARPCRTGTEAVLWADDIAADAARSVGLSTHVPDPLSSADRALAAAETFAIAPLCTALYADALLAARRIAEDEGILPHEQRRRRLLRTLAPRMGPVHLEHTAARGDQVARTAAHLARLMQLDAETIRTITLAALLHGIGKLAFPEDLLARRQCLSPRERTILARHPSLGAAIARELGLPADCRAGIERHHDRNDADPEPPLAARVVRVADALVTMTTARASSPARAFTEALAELRRDRGTLYDPDAVVAAHLLGAGAMALAA